VKEKRIDMKVTSLGAFALLVLAVLAVAAGPARAQDPTGKGWEPEKFGFEIAETGRIGSSDAGAHPTVWTRFKFKTFEYQPGVHVPFGIPHRVAVDMPYGLIGNPQAVPKCTREQLFALQCPPQSQVGVANPWPSPFPEPLPDRPIYLVESDDTGPAVLAIDVIGELKNFAFLRIQVRPDGGLRTVTDPFPRGTALIQNRLELWGVPADENKCNPNHPEYDPDKPSPYSGLIPRPCPRTDPEDWERRPFMTSPTDCSIIPTSVLRGYAVDGRVSTFQAAQPHPPENCESLVFEPSFRAQPTNPSADGVSGLAVDIDVPQNDDPDGRATPRLRKVEVTLAEGISINPGAAPNLEACPDSAFGKGQEGPARCPQASKVGNLRITSPLLEEPLPGDIYIGQPLPGDRYRLFLFAEHRGVIIKLAGSLRPDERTGQIKAIFDDNPPLPFSNLHLEFRGGTRGVLAMPQTCGVKTSRAVFWPNSGQPPVTSESSFTVTSCPEQQPFAPTLSAGTANPLAGAYSPLNVTFGKPDQHQALSGITVELPPGLLGKVRDVPLCSDADADRGTCPEASRVGAVTTAAGPGPHPLFLDGKVFLTGPYKGAPYGLAIAVPAIAGPYDLGMVVVRQAIHVDPTDASLTVVSDPLPTILEGVPLRLQRIDVKIDRPEFTLNPTSCEPMRLGATLTSVQDARAALEVPFQVKGCSALPLRPKMQLRLTGEREMTDGRHPGLQAAVTQQPGEAGLRQVAVRLPLSLALDPDNAQELCEFEAGQRAECPARSIIGEAVAESPVLKQPLRGPVYFVKNVRTTASGRQVRTLPTLLVTLRGEVALNLRATSDVVDDHLVSTFSAVPDAPISSFRLNLKGGRNGILVANTNICAERQVASVEVDGHNGRTADFRTELALPCPLKVLSRQVSGRTVRLRIGGLRPGRLVVSGRGIRTVTRTIRSQQFLTVNARLTAAGRRAARTRRGVAVTVRLTPQGAKSRTTRVRARMARAR
jgi:hypothetical protein